MSAGERDTAGSLLEINTAIIKKDEEQFDAMGNLLPEGYQVQYDERGNPIADGIVHFEEDCITKGCSGKVYYDICTIPRDEEMLCRECMEAPLYEDEID